MPQRLPTLGESPYKTILDGFLTVIRNEDGTLKPNLGLSDTPYTFTAIGGQANVASLFLNPTSGGATQQTVLYSKIAGAATDGATGRLAGIFEAVTGGAGAAENPIWGLNVNVMQQAVDSTVQMTGIELSVNSNKGDATLDMNPPQVGYAAVSDGSHIAQIAFNAGGVAKWTEGYRVDQGTIATGGYAFRYKGSGGADSVAISHDGKLQLGFLTGLGDPAEIMMLNAKNIYGLNQAGTDIIPMIQVDASDRISLNANSLALTIRNAATQATIGANGAASALTANPVGYLVVNVGGSNRVVPYYNP